MIFENNPGILSPPLIYAAMSKIMFEVGPIAKDRKNQAQGYSFRGVDDAYQALQPVMARHGVFSVPTVLDSQRSERQTKSGGTMTYSILRIKYTFYATDGSFVECVVEGEASDTGDKSTNKSLSVAHKYALLQVFCIPTEDDKDPENHSPEFKPAAKPAAGAQKQGVAASSPQSQGVTPKAPFQGREPMMGKEDVKVTDKQLARMHAIARGKGLDHEGIKTLARSIKIEGSSKDMDRVQYDRLIEAIEKLP